MIIFKPDWVCHADKTQEAKGKKPCIYSIHVHPDGTRLATGGLDGKVRIWNTEPIYDEEAEKDPNCNKLLCTMTMHNGAVLCVRWSNQDGHYLASGSDNDNVIIIWEKDVNAKVSSIFGSTEINYETWKPVKYLRGHESDVQDLAWSKDNKYLASCGVDGHVIVWDGRTFEQIKKIDKHEGFVKGISWDPAGKYLASQSDDKMVKIWRTYDWGLETNIKNPFVNAPGTTLFRRLSWSPDGCHFAAANAVNSIKCVAAIVSRDDWNADISLVGHKLPVEVTCFNPKMFYMSDDNEVNGHGEKSVSSICALGSQDRSISIWVTKFSKPICVAADIFDNNVYDLAWSPNGKCLFACSQDGTIACLQFEEELSDVVPESIVRERLEKYGYGKDQTQLLETPVQLELEQATDTEPALPPRVADLMDGNASIGNQDTVMTEVPSLAPAPPNVANISSSTSQQPTILEQKVSITKDGKKRIQPISLNMRTSAMHSPSAAQIPSIQTQPMNHNSQHSSKINQTNSVVNVDTVVIGNKRPASDEEVNEVIGSKPTRARPNWLDSAVAPPIVQKSLIKMALPKVRTVLSTGLRPEDPTVVMECHNAEDAQSTIRAKLVITRQGTPIWMDYLSSAILVMTSNAEFCAAGCEDGSIHVYSPAGRRILPVIVLESTPVLLQSHHQWLVCITATGLLYSWDVLNVKSRVDGISIAPVLQVAQLETDKTHRAPSIKDVRIQKNGLPILLTSSHQAFVYHTDMKVWLRISDAWYIISEFWGSARQTGDHPLAWLSSRMSTYGADRSMHMLLDVSAATKVVTLSHIEMQLAVAALLESPTEYKDWMIYYARRLSEENAKNKVEELCKWLTGPPYAPFPDIVKWEPTILGKISKKELLAEILPLLAKNRQLQRTVAEFTSCL